MLLTFLKETHLHGGYVEGKVLREDNKEEKDGKNVEDSDQKTKPKSGVEAVRKLGRIIQILESTNSNEAKKLNLLKLKSNAFKAMSKQNDTTSDLDTINEMLPKLKLDTSKKLIGECKRIITPKFVCIASNCRVHSMPISNFFLRNKVK